MKKILIITAVSGFLYKFEQDNVKILQEMGYEVHLASNAENKVYDYDDGIYEKMGVIFHDVRIYQSPFYVFRNYKALRQINQIIKDENINVIHCHTPTGGILGRLAGMSAKDQIKVLYTVHGFHFYEGCRFKNKLLYKTAEKYFAKHTDILITINHEDFAAAKKMKLKKDGKVFYIPGVGLDMKHFYEVSLNGRKAARTKLGLKDEMFFVSVGEVRENKNQMMVLKALTYLKNTNYDLSKVKYGVIGSGKQLEELKTFADNSGISGSVKFYGYQEDVRSYLEAADCMTFTSVREGLGMAALEALAMGVPVIATDNRGTREYMVEDVNGYICNQDDYQKLADKIRFFVDSRWSESVDKRNEIRSSVKYFEKNNTMTIMRGVYEGAES